MTDTSSLPRETDVVIVGGGIMGTSVAYFLTTRTDLDVCLLERDRIGAGSTGDSVAVLRHHYGSEELYSKLAWWSHQFYRSFETHTGESIAYAESPLLQFVRKGTPEATVALAGFEVLEALDIPVSKLDPATVTDRFPMLAFDEYDFVISDETAGYTDGADVANGFARAASAAGAQIVTGVDVTDVLDDADHVVGVDTDSGRISCSEVVVAAGPWTPRLVERLGVTVPLTIEREQVVVLDPPPSYRDTYSDRLPTTSLPNGPWNVRPDFGGNILAATHHSGDAVDPDRYDSTPDESRLLQLTEQIEASIPSLADAGIAGQYCGIYATTPDHDFVIDRVGPTGCTIVNGFSGHGLKHAPAIGRIVSDLLIRDETDLADLDRFSLDRFERRADGNDNPDFPS